MQRAVILYNPQSGLRQARRLADVETAARVLAEAGVKVGLEATTGPRSAGPQAKRFVADGFDTIIAGGGDGTIHDTLQGLVGGEVSLGVLPLGTANSLACDLGIPRNPARAANLLLSAQPRRIAVGQIEYQHNRTQRNTRYFTVAAGVGVDAALFYKLNAQFKKRWGMVAYCAEALRQWTVQRFHPFRVEWFDQEQRKRSEVVTQLLVVRIANFGGVLRKLAPGADLMRDDFRLVLFKTRSRARYLRFVTSRLIDQDWADKNIELVHASQLWCMPHRDESEHRHAAVHAEADGEWLGRLPVQISLVPNSLNLLVPATASSLLFPHR
jgi:YegS/Rv2252/BmrU family lipid kinase